MVPASEKETDDKIRGGGGGENILSKAPFLPPSLRRFIFPLPSFPAHQIATLDGPSRRQASHKPSPLSPSTQPKPNLPNPTRGPKQWVSSFPLSHDP